jgi:hypothetical protein
VVHRRRLLAIAIGLLIVGEPLSLLLHSITTDQTLREAVDLATVAMGLTVIVLILLSLRPVPPRAENVRSSLRRTTH